MPRSFHDHATDRLAALERALGAQWKRCGSAASIVMNFVLRLVDRLLAG
jgi:hypothetical protein